MDSQITKEHRENFRNNWVSNGKLGYVSQNKETESIGCVCVYIYIHRKIFVLRNWPWDYGGWESSSAGLASKQKTQERVDVAFQVQRFKCCRIQEELTLQRKPEDSLLGEFLLPPGKWSLLLYLGLQLIRWDSPTLWTVNCFIKNSPT